MTEQESPHIIDQIEAYLSEGLSADERLALESHAAACAACGDALAEARQADERLQELFSQSAPAAGFEDRIIRKLRAARSPRRRLIHPMVWRSAAAVAAAVLVAGTGMVVTQTINGGHRRSGARVLLAAESNRSPQVIDKFDTEKLPSLNFLQSQAEAMADRKGAAHEWGSSQSPSSAGPVKPTISVPDGGTLLLGGQVVESDSTMRPLVVARNPAGELSAAGTMEYRSGGSVRLAGSSVTVTDLGTDTYAGTTIINGGGAVSSTSHGSADSSFHPGTELNASTPLLVSGRPDARQLEEVADKVEEPKEWAKAADQEKVVKKAAAQWPPSGAQPQGVKPGEAQGAAAPGAPDAPAYSARKIIRDGTMEFEVDRFDDALIRVTKLVNEQQGFVGTTDSDKLPNGKMKGTVTLRVPPERLDTLVLTLRGIGDLKSQKITAEDVTKHYTDLESELRADRAMEERLLAIIKTGTGQIKDLLAAEKELGVWREKIERIEGEKRYLDNQISLSTLVLTLYEKDIRTPASASQTEQVTMSLETEKVADAYEKVLEAIKSAKGRIRQSELKQYDAGQFGATIVAAIPPDAAESVIARVRGLEGRIAHFAREQKQTTQNGATVPADVLHVDREDTILSLQIYNLANIAPRRTTTMRVAVAQVDRTFQQFIDLVRSAGGRVVTSNLNKPDPNTQVAELDVQTPTEKAQSVLDAVQGYGEIMQQESAENPDTADVTEAKRRFRITLISLAAVPPRETQALQMAAKDVPGAFNDILNAVRGADGRVLQSDLREPNAQDVSGTIEFEMNRTASAAVMAAIDKSAQLLTRTVNRSSDTQNTADSKVRLSLSLVSAERLPPRQTTTISEEVPDVEHSVDDLASAALSAGGRRIGSGEMNQDAGGNMTAQVVVEVPLNKVGPILDQVERMGRRRSKQVSFDNAVPDGPLARARIDVTFSNSAASLGGEETTWDAIQHGLSVSGRGLRWSAQMLVVGLCFVAPWVIALWVIWKLVRRSRSRSNPPANPA